MADAPPPADPGAAVVVVGSANVDRTVRVRRLPSAGETVAGSAPATAPGGKGLNQAVAARRMGATVAFVGALGDDEDGRVLRRCIHEEGIVDATRTVDEATGGALVVVDDEAENLIVVSAGANATLDGHHVAEAADLVSGASVVLTQLEVPLPAVTEALRLATGTRILTPAPARPLGRELLGLVDVLVPNRGELVALVGGEVADGLDGLATAARSLEVPTVVVTLGADGALVVTASATRHAPAPTVQATDTTGAGDTFSGALAAALAAGSRLDAAVDVAVAAAALSVTDDGAQRAMPRRAAVLELLDALVDGGGPSDPSTAR